MSGREGLLLNGEQDQVPLGKIVQLSQIRGDRNRVTTALKYSILQEGLLYPPIVASVSPALLKEYISFTNRTWGGDADFDDFADRLRPDGNYYLMVAGHTRCAAVEELINEGALPANIEMPVKVVKMGSVMDIVSVQRAEICIVHLRKSVKLWPLWSCTFGVWRMVVGVIKKNFSIVNPVKTLILREARYVMLYITLICHQEFGISF